MKNNIIAFFIFFITSIGTIHAQKIQLISKDKRILKYREQLVKYLIEKKQLDSIAPFKMKYYLNKMYVIKRLEFFNSEANNLILVQFGDLSDHGWVCWGLLGINKIYLFTNTHNSEFEKLSQENRVPIVSTVRAYVESMR